MIKPVLEPAERAEMVRSISEQLNVTHQQILSVHRHNMRARGKEPTFGTTLHGLTLAHGIGRFGARLPAGKRKLASKQCFMHATQLMHQHRRYVYCEGYALKHDLGMAMAHAWVLDAYDGYRVIDNTWENPEIGCYLGIPFAREFVTATTLRTGVYGIMDNWMDDFPVLTMAPEEFLHPSADEIPADFTVAFDPDAENMFERLRLIEEASA